MNGLLTGHDVVWIAFLAGGAWAILHQMRKEIDAVRKDLNGASARERRFEKSTVRTFNVLFDNREDRERIGEFFKD